MATPLAGPPADIVTVGYLHLAPDVRRTIRIAMRRLHDAIEGGQHLSAVELNATAALARELAVAAEAAMLRDSDPIWAQVV